MFSRIRLHRQLSALHRQGVKLGSFSQLHGEAHLHVECPSSPGNIDVRYCGARPVVFGAYSYMRSGGDLHHVSRIGRFCSIADNVLVGAHPRLHPLDWLSTHPFQYDSSWPLHRELQTGLRYAEPVDDVVIGNDVWIGANVIIHAGVTIGDGAVIAHNSVVTRSVESYAIVAGIPAKPVGQRFDAAKAALLLQLRWWDLPTVQLKGISFNNIDGAIGQLQQLRRSNPADAVYPVADISADGYVSLG